MYMFQIPDVLRVNDAHIEIVYCFPVTARNGQRTNTLLTSACTLTIAIMNHTLHGYFLFVHKTSQILGGVPRKMPDLMPADVLNLNSIATEDLQHISIYPFSVQLTCHTDFAALEQAPLLHRAQQVLQVMYQA